MLLAVGLRKIHALARLSDLIWLGLPSTCFSNWHSTCFFHEKLRRQKADIKICCAVIRRSESEKLKTREWPQMSTHCYRPVCLSGQSTSRKFPSQIHISASQINFFISQMNFWASQTRFCASRLLFCALIMLFLIMILFHKIELSIILFS